jgi:hypothetical protein
MDGRLGGFSFIASGVGLSPCTAATSGLLYQPKMIGEGDCGTKIGRGNRSTRRKPSTATLCPPQIPLDQTRDRTRAAAVGSQRLTAWARARPSYTFYTRSYLLGFTFPTAVVMKISIFWDMRPCSPLKVNRRFAFIFRLCYLPPSGVLLGLFFNSEDGGDMFIRNVHWFWKNYTSLYRARQNDWFFITTITNMPTFVIFQHLVLYFHKLNTKCRWMLKLETNI